MNQDKQCTCCNKLPPIPDRPYCELCTQLDFLVKNNRSAAEVLLQIHATWPTVGNQIFKSRWHGQHLIMPICHSELTLRTSGIAIEQVPIELVVGPGRSLRESMLRADVFRYIQLCCGYYKGEYWTRDAGNIPHTVTDKTGTVKRPDTYLAFDYYVDCGDDGHTIFERRGSFCLLCSELRDILRAASRGWKASEENYCLASYARWLKEEGKAVPSELEDLQYAFFPFGALHKHFNYLLDPKDIIL